MHIHRNSTEQRNALDQLTEETLIKKNDWRIAHNYTFNYAHSQKKTKTWPRV